MSVDILLKETLHSGLYGYPQKLLFCPQGFSEVFRFIFSHDSTSLGLFSPYPQGLLRRLFLFKYLLLCETTRRNLFFYVLGGDLHEVHN